MWAMCVDIFVNFSVFKFKQITEKNLQIFI